MPALPLVVVDLHRPIHQCLEVGGASAVHQRVTNGTTEPPLERTDERRLIPSRLFREEMEFYRVLGYGAVALPYSE